jgi:hypothetical protein
MDGTSGGVEEIRLKHAEKNENGALWTVQHDSEHPGRHDGTQLAVDATQPAHERLSRLDVEGIPSSEYAMDPRMAFSEVTHHETINDSISPKTVLQPIGKEKKAMAIDDQVSAPNVLKQTSDDASGIDAAPTKATPATTESSEGPPLLSSVLASTFSRTTSSAPIALRAPAKTKGAGDDIRPPLDVLVVDDDK